MSTNPDSFIYEHPERGKCEIFYTAVAKQDGKEIAADLTSSQIEFIKKALMNEILLDVSKRHDLKISVLKDDAFHVTIDNKTKFFVNVKANKEIVVIQEKIKKRDFFGNSFIQFFKFIATLFYSPSIPDKSSKERTPQEAVREDYSMLKRGLESGRAWLQPKKEIAVSGTDLEQKNKLVEKVDQTIKNAGTIEKALKSRSPHDSLNKLSSEWSNYLFNNLRDNEEFLIPVGYLNSDNSLEPVMLRFYKEKGVMRLEIYAETTEAGAKVNPIQLREFTGQLKRSQIAELLNTFFRPLIPLESKPLEVPQGLETFEEIYRTKRDEELAKKGLAKKNISPLEAHEEQKTVSPSSHLTFESLLRSLDNQMGGSWIALTSEELAKPSDSPPARVVKYFDHLLSQMGGGGISQNGKINLLYHLIEGWLESQESRIGKKTSEEKQLEIYQDCLKQLNHVINKIATAINDGHPLDPEWIPSHLKDKKKFYEQKIVELQKNRRVASIEMTDAFLGTPLSGDLGLAVGSEIRREGDEPPKVEPQKTLHLERWERKWEDSLQALKGLVTEERWAHYQGFRAAGELAAVLEDNGLSWDDFSDDLQSKNEDILVQRLIQSLLIKNGDLERLINQAKADARLVSYAKKVDDEFILEFAEALRQLILFPHLLPQYDQQKCPLPRAYFLTLAARFQDSELFISGQNDASLRTLRALFGLRHLIPQERRLEMEASNLRSRSEAYLRIKREQKADSNPNVIAIEQMMREDVAQENPFEQMKAAETAPSEIKDVEALKRAGREYQEEILKHISHLVQRCNELNEQAINEPNLERRKELLQQVKEHALMALRTIPPPSITGALGENSIWNDLDLNQSLAASADVSRLEHLVWEVQMKLAETEIDGRDRFLMIKAQTIRQSIIHSQIRKVKARIEDLLNNAYVENKEKVEYLISENIMGLDQSGRLKINVPIAPMAIGRLRETIKELIPEGDPLPPISLLAFENKMVDTLSYNELLSQDLTARLSEDAEMERDLMSVYRFIVREYNAGVEDTLQSGEERFRGEFRTPLFNNYRNLGLIPQAKYRPNPSNHLGINIPDSDPSRQFLEESAESFFMYRTMSDPDFTLYTSNPVLGVPYFQSRPVAFLQQNELKIHITENRVSDIVAIVGDGAENLAQVYVEGHPNFSNDAALGENDPEKISKKRPFLPIVDNKPALPSEIRLEQRIYRPLPTWLKYIEEVSKGESLLVPPQVLASLFLIRESPIVRDKSVSTSYSSETAVRALAFIIHPDNQKYLQYDFVQKYLEESLFGSFLMQQALVDHPEAINSFIEPLIRAMENSVEGDNDLAFGFLSNVLKQLTAHAKFTQESLTKEGWFSGLLMGTLPAHLGKYGGVFEQTLKIVEELTQDSRGHKLEVEAGELSPMQVSQPLLSRYEEIAKAAQNFAEASELIPSLEKRYFERNEKGYYIDRIKKLSVRKQMYSMAIESFKLADEPLNKEQLRHILMGYELLLDPALEPGDLLKEKRLTEWVRTVVLPQFHQLDPEEKNAILTEMANAKLSRQKMEPVHGSWEQTKENPQVYRLTSSGRNLEINVYNANLMGIQTSAAVTQKFIPHNILAREDVRQALKADKILATETKRGKEVTYEWMHEGQKFKMVLGERLIIQRTFDVGTDKVEELTFTFQPVVVEDVEDNAHALMAENGFWIDEKYQSGLMFTKGMALPNESTTFKVEYHHSPQGLVIDHLKPVDAPERIVSASPKFRETSPFLFASNKNLIFILKTDKTTGEFRLKNSNISFRFNNSEQRWICYRGNEKIGIVLYPKNEQAVESHFGDNWDQFVIPLVDNSGRSQYLLIPYNQEINNKGKAVANQDSFQEMDRVEFLRTEEDGLIKGSIASDLYLADRFIRQAAQTKNATAANALYLRAEEHLQRLKLPKPPSDPVELQRLVCVIDTIKENPPVSMQKGVPSIAGLSLNLRLMLTIRKLRENIAVPSQKVLQLNPTEDFEELESITKLYHGYQVLKKEASSEKLHKTVLRLTEDEDGELQMISRQLIQEAAHLEGVQTYFGATGRLESPISLERPTELDPQFLLTLLRSAKKPESGKDITKITGPLPLNDLLENFWSYFLSIREQQLEPDELIFLFSESVLPPVKSAEEEAYLRKMDRQARQFLLVFADLQQSLKQDPKEALEKELEGAKSKVLEVFGPQGELKDLLGILRKDLGLEAIQMAETFNQIQIISKEVQFGKKKMVLPDVEKLATDVTDLDSRLYQFVFSIKNVVSEAKNFAEGYRAEYNKIKKEISEIENNLVSESSKGKEKSSEEDEEWRRALEERKEQLVKQLEDLLRKKVNNPVNGEEITVEMVITGEFENTVQLENLEKFSNSCLQIHQSIQENLKHAKEAMQKLELLTRLETAIGELQTKSFEPHPSLSFPSDPESTKKLKELMTTFETAKFKEMSLLEKTNFIKKNALALFKQIGIRKGFGLISKLVDYQQGKLVEKMALFAIPLEGLALLGVSEPVAAGKKLPPSLVSLELEALLENPAAKQCFSAGQLSEIRKKVASMPQSQQQSYLAKLSSAIGLSESNLSAQISLSANLSKIDQICQSLGILDPEELQTPLIASKVDRNFQIPITDRSSGFEAKYGGLFRGRNDFPADYSKAAELLEQKQIVYYAGIEGRKVTESGVDYLRKKLEPKQDISRLPEKLQKHFYEPEFLPLIGAVEVIVGARLTAPEAAAEVLQNIQEAKTGLDLLRIIEEGHRRLAPQYYQDEHLSLVAELSHTLPGKRSAYTKDLERGFSNLKDANPLPYSKVAAKDQIDYLKTVIKSDGKELRENLKLQEDAIVQHLKKIPVQKLPHQLQLIRFRNGSDQELLQAAYFQQSNSIFANVDPELDKMISMAQIDAARLKILSSAKFNALKSIEALEILKHQRNELLTEYAQLAKELKEALGKENVKQKKIKSLREKQTALLARIKAVDAVWLKESNRLKDCLDRCQSTEHLTSKEFPDRLKPHFRKILYLQNKLGVVLRNDQIEALKQMVENPSLLLQMRMGLGKTSLLTPFIFSILAAEGYNVIGMVPKSQFAKNFDDMDETTRVVFEMAGKQFLFNRESAPQPFSPVILQKISQQCRDFFTALENHGYILTTIESKASLDDKINEIEESQLSIQKALKEAESQGEESLGLVDNFYAQLGEHQIALDLLYRVKATFEHRNTRLIIDEADQVGRANYSVNSETGIQEKPAPLIVQTAETIFSIIQDREELLPLREQIYSNNQFTLKKEEVDEYIQLIGRAWLEEYREKPGFPEALKDEKIQDRILEWFAGEPSAFSRAEFQEFGPFGNELKAMRKGLNQGLRASLALKIGLNADFDSIHFALGVPASQGVTSPTTKYSDPMMQLCLTNMVAMYKVQSEKFLTASVSQVMEQLNREIERQAEPDPALLAARQILLDLDKIRQEGGVPSYEKALTGSEPEKVFLRLQFAKQVAERKLIYISSGQISRAVQNALRGCNVIGLTGTATRNLTHVLSSNGNQEAMKNLDATGRQTTAEVVYRWVKSLPQGLKTPVQTYPSENTLAWFASFAKSSSGYNFLINQAGICDTHSQKELVNALHAEAKRPIVFLDLETDKNSVMINGMLKQMSNLTEEEKKEVRERGFYYYHTPHARGTHFDIPTGSKGALMLSPNVNASDRDQAAYRARELGEGHVVDPFISEVQSAEIQASKSGEDQTVRLEDLLKAQHDKTLSDEEKENLAAYRLHITGQLILAADKAKKNLQFAGSETIKQKGKWASERQMNEQAIESRTLVFELLRNFFIQESGNMVLIRKLDLEISQGGEIATRQSLQELVDQEKKRAERLVQRLQEEQGKHQDNPLAVKALADTIRQLESAIDSLTNESKRIRTGWNELKRLFSETTSAISTDQETAEVEADKETEEEKESEVETLMDKKLYERRNAARKILETPDNEILDSLPVLVGMSNSVNGMTLAGILDLNDSHKMQQENIWKPNVFVSPRLKSQIKGGVLPEMKVLIVKDDTKTPFIGILDPWEGDHVASSDSYWVNAKENKLFNGGVFQVSMEPNGDLKLIYSASAPFMKGVSEEFQTAESQAEMLISLIHLGVTRLTDEQWGGIEAYWRKLGADDRQVLQKSLENTLEKSNPSFLGHTVAIHLWNKPESLVSLGKPKEVSKDLERAKGELDDYMKLFEKTSKEEKERQLERWLNRNASEELKDELENYGKGKY